MGNSFNPDAYLAANAPAQKLGAGTGFNPDAYLAAHNASVEPSPMDYWLSDAVPGGGSAADVLGHMAKAGGAINRGAQSTAERMAENQGRINAAIGYEPKNILSKVADVAIPGALATASEFAVPQNRLAAGLTALPYLGKPLAAGANFAGKAMPAISEAASKVPGILRSAFRIEQPAAKIASEVPALAAQTPAAIKIAEEAAPEIAKSAKPGFRAKLIQRLVGPGMPIGSVQYALDHPEVLSDAKSIEDATKDYVAAIPGLKDKFSSLGDSLGKIAPSHSDFEDVANKAMRLITGNPSQAEIKAGEKMTSQTALDGVQSINQIIRD